MVKTIGVISIKGGVGKTTIASSLAANLVNHYGKKVLLVDANYSAPNLGLHMNIIEPVKTIHDVLANKARAKSAIHTRYGVDVIPGSYVCNRKLNYMKLKDRLKPIAKDYDFIILDSSPTLNDEMFSTMLASDNLFVVSTPDYPTLFCSMRATKIAKQRGRPVSGIILNKVRDPKYELTLKEIEDSAEVPVIAKIPDDKAGTRALFTGIPISIFNRKSKFAKEIEAIGAALTNTTKKRNIFRRLLGVKREEVNRQLFRDSFYKSMFEK